MKFIGPDNPEHGGLAFAYGPNGWGVFIRTRGGWFAIRTGSRTFDRRAIEVIAREAMREVRDSAMVVGRVRWYETRGHAFVAVDRGTLLLVAAGRDCWGAYAGDWTRDIQFGDVECWIEGRAVGPRIHATLDDLSHGRTLRGQMRDAIKKLATWRKKELSAARARVKALES